MTKAGKTFLAAIPAAICLFSFKAQAETRISTVYLEIDSQIQVGDTDSDVTVTADSSAYDVDDVEVTNEPDENDEEWEEGDKPRLKVIVQAEDDYYFPSGFSKSSVELDGSDGTVTSVDRSSDELEIYITLDALDEDEEDYDLDVLGLEWDQSSGIAYWDECEDARRYEVRLYRDGSAATSILTSYDSQYDFFSYLSHAGTYTFRVRAVYSSSVKGDWEESEEWDVMSGSSGAIGSFFSPTPSLPANTAPASDAASSQGAWLKDDTGWWYCNADKSYTTNDWQFIGGSWYYFDESGYMVTGWVYWNEQWYYCGENGKMLTNSMTPDGYYVGADGAWVS